MCMSCVVIVKAIQSYPLGWLWRHMNSGNRAGSLVYFFLVWNQRKCQTPKSLQPFSHGTRSLEVMSKKSCQGWCCMLPYSFMGLDNDGHWAHERRERCERHERPKHALLCYTFWADFPSTAVWQQLWHLVRESNGNGFEDCKVEMCWAVQGCAGFVPRRCLWASARFTVRTLFHCDLMSVPWQRQIFELTNLYDFFKDPTKRKMKGMIIG